VYVVPYAILAYLENARLEKTAFLHQISPQTGGKMLWISQ